MSRCLRVLGWAVVVLVAAVALVSLHPPLTMQVVIAQLVALRTFMALGWGLLGLFLLGTVLLRRRLARSRAVPLVPAGPAPADGPRAGQRSSAGRGAGAGTGRGAEPGAGTGTGPHVGLRTGTGLRTGALALVLVLVALVHGGVLLGRGMSVRPLSAAAEAAPDGAVTVMSLNTEREGVAVGDAAEAAAAVRADVVVLPETNTAYGKELADQLRATVGNLSVYTAVSPPYGWHDEDGDGLDDDSGADHGVDPVRATTVLVSERLGAYRQTQGPAGAGRGLVMLEPVDGSGPVIAGIHTYPPVPGLMEEWRSSLSTVAALCQEPPKGLVLAGDFNATRDHAPLRDLHACASAGEQAGVGGLATWPTHTGTRLLGATIDHVLIDASSWRARSGEVLTVPGTDHRAVVVRLAQR